MAATDKEEESESEEGENEEDEDVDKQKEKKKKKKSSPETNVTYFGGINISDSRRTTLAYVSALFSLTGLVLAVLIFISGLREDNYLSDFSDLVKGYSGGGIFTMMMVIGAVGGVIQLFGCHICFRVTISVERKKLYYWMWVYMMALIGLLVAFVVANLVGLFYWLNAHGAFKGGIHHSMMLYESRLKVKTSIDQMQIDFQCCGSKNYKDWWKVGWWGVRWLDVSTPEVRKKMLDDRTYLTDSVPFSCCDPRVRRPCVHHNMRDSFQHTKYDSSNVTVYDVGCTQALSNHYAQTVLGFLKLLLAAFVVELCLTVTFRYLQTSTGAAIEEDDMDMETRGYLWTVSANKKKEPKPAGGKASPTGGRASPSKSVGKRDREKASAAKKAGGASKKRAAKSEKGKNRNNIGPNNNNLEMQGNYNNMAVDQVGQQAEYGAAMLPRSGAMSVRQAPVTRMPSNATLSTSRQTSATYVSGSSRQTSGTRLTDGTPQYTNEARSASRQQSYNSVATRSSATTSGMRSSATGRSSSASTVRPVPNMSRNNNVDTATETVSPSVADQHQVEPVSTSDLPAEPQIHHHQQQQQRVVADSEVQRSSPPVVRDVERAQRPEVPRPVTPIPIPQVHRPTMASTRLPTSIPIADYRTLPPSSRAQTRNPPNGNGKNFSPAIQQTRGTGRNNAAMQIPLASVSKPSVGQSLAGVGASNIRNILVHTVPESTVAPPPLPPRSVSTSEASPYVMMYPIRPPRNHLTMTRPHTVATVNTAK